MSIGRVIVGSDSRTLSVSRVVIGGGGNVVIISSTITKSTAIYANGGRVTR